MISPEQPLCTLTYLISRATLWAGTMLVYLTPLLYHPPLYSLTHWPGTYKAQSCPWAFACAVLPTWNEITLTLTKPPPSHFTGLSSDYTSDYSPPPTWYLPPPPILFLFFVWLACGILFPWPGIEPGPLAVKAWSPNHWVAWKILTSPYFCLCTAFTQTWCKLIF